jgi:hypothetical protein
MLGFIGWAMSDDKRHNLLSKGKIMEVESCSTGSKSGQGPSKMQRADQGNSTVAHNDWDMELYRGGGKYKCKGW